MRSPFLSVLGLVFVLITGLALPSALAAGKKAAEKKAPSPPEKLEPCRAATPPEKLNPGRAGTALDAAVAAGNETRQKKPPTPPQKLVPGRAGTALDPAVATRKKKSSSRTVDLEPAQAITRRIWKDARFVFEGKTGDVVSLKVTGKTPGIDPHVTLLDPAHGKEAFDDDSGGHGNSLIKNHPLKRTGPYTVVVGLAGSDEGEVEILFEKAKPNGGS